MSVSPQIWQQFIDLVFQDELIKLKQNFDVHDPGFHNCAVFMSYTCTKLK